MFELFANVKKEDVLQIIDTIFLFFRTLLGIDNKDW